MAAAEKYKTELIRTANSLVADGKGLLAADESIGSIEKRFKAVNVENNEERRRNWREVLFVFRRDRQIFGRHNHVRGNSYETQYLERNPFS